MAKGSSDSVSKTEKQAIKSVPTIVRKLTRKQLINRLNSLNFNQGEVLISLRHNRFDSTLLLPARPTPCSGEELECIWADPMAVPDRLADFSCDNFLLNDGRRSYAVHPRLLSITDKKIRFALPVSCNETAMRGIRRHPGHGIKAQLIQNGTIFAGHLVDFSPFSFRVDMTFSGHQCASWLNPEQPAELVLLRDDSVFFAGACQILRENTLGPHQHSLILAPNRQIVSRYRPKEFRSTRQRLIPTPIVSFIHPLTGQQVDLQVDDISGSGFSVIEETSESLLVPGMLIPELKLCFTSNFIIKGSAQIVYRLPTENDNTQVRCGITFLDIPAEDHVQLMALLHRAEDPMAGFSQNIDLKKLWDFFFESGFLYPEKYASVASNLASFQETYRKLYASSPGIARHFIHQDKGQIKAHMAALRFYNNSWMLHHHASNNKQSTRAGLNVLNQTGRWVNDVSSIRSGHFDYFFCYFRKNNRFPQRVFGGLADNVNDRNKCSVDIFAYYYHQPPASEEWDLQQPWSLARANKEDMQEFNYYYQSIAGGILPTALDLLPETFADQSLNEEFQRHGFKRERIIYTLKENGLQRAIIIVNLADTGLNMSEITSAIQVFIFEPETLPRSVLDLILSLLCCKTKRKKAPILLYPESYAEENDISIEKKYSLFIFDTKHLDHYFRHLQSLIRSINH